MDGSFSAVIGARISQFQAQMRRVREEIRRSAQDVEIDVDANINPLARAIVRIRQRIAQLEDDHVRITFEARIQNFQAAISRIATNIRAFGELAQNTIGGVFTSLIPLLAPLVASAGAAIGNLGASVGALGGGALGLATAFGTAGIAAVAFGAVAIPIIAKLFDEEAKLTKQQQAAKKSFDDLSKTFKNVQKLVEQPVLDSFSSALEAINTVLFRLRPLILETAYVVSDLVEAFRYELGSTSIQDFFTYLNLEAPKILGYLGTSGINIVKALASSFTAFAPLTEFIAKGLQNLTQRFSEFTEGLKYSNKFYDFLDYTIANLPKLGSIFGNLVVGIVQFFAAFSGSSQGFLDGLVSLTARFKEFSSTLSDNQGFQNFLTYVQTVAPGVLSLIGQLTTFLVNLGIALAPVGQVLLGVVTSVLAFANGFLESNRAVGVFLASLIPLTGILIAIVPNIIAFSALTSGLGSSLLIGLGKAIPFVVGLFTNFGSTIATLGPKLTAFANVAKTAFTALTGPIGIAVAAIALFVAALVKLYKENEEFRNKVDVAWAKIKEIFTTVVNAILEVVTSVWRKILSFWTDNQDQIQSVTSKVWDNISAKILFVVNTISALFTAVWPIISNTVKIAWDLITSIITIGVDLVLGLISAALSLLNGNWSEGWETIKATGERIWGTIVKFFTDIDLSKIGSEIIAGLAKGITDGYNTVKKAAMELAAKLPQWMKDVLNIHSPSRVTAEIGGFVSQGVAVGITSNLNVVRKATETLSKAAIPDFKEAVEATKDLMNQAKKVAASVTNDSKKEIAQIEADYAKKREEATKKANSSIAEINAKANDKEKKLTAAQQRQILKAKETENSSLAKLELEKQNKIESISSKAEKERYSALKTYADRQVALEKFTSSELAGYYEYVARTFKEGTDERIEAQIEYNKAIKTLTTEQFNAEKDSIDKKKKYSQLSLNQELQSYIEYGAAYKKGSEEQIYYAEKVEETKKAINDRLIALNEDYTTKIKNAQESEIEGIANLQKAYQDQEDSRAQSLANTSGIFDEVTRKTEVFGSTLITNLQSQVTALREWSNNLKTLASRGVEDGLLGELQQLGPGAVDEIQALTILSDSQLQEYVSIWKERSSLAREQAQFELAGTRKDTSEQIAKLQADTKTQLTQYQNEWVMQIKAIRTGATNEFNPLTASLKEIGMNAIKGLTEGLKSQVPELQVQAKAIADTIDQTIRKTLQIKSPSRVTMKSGVFVGQGLAEGLASTKSILSNAIGGLTGMLLNDISATSLGLDTNLTGGVNSNVLSSYEISSGNDQIGVLRQIASLIGRLDFRVELDGDVISEKIDKNRGDNYSSISTVRGY